MQLPPGPYRHIAAGDGTSVPFYVIPFDKDGVCEGPETRRHLLNSLAQEEYTDVYLFSHGWNNDWTTAVGNYEHFINGYMGMRRRHNLTVDGPYRPLAIGVFWPSTALVFTETEVGPDIAAADPTAQDHAVSVQRQAMADLAAELDRDQRPRFYALMQKETLDEQEAKELAAIVKGFFGSRDDEVQVDEEFTLQEIVDLWRAMMPVADADDDEFGTVDGSAGGGPQAAALFGFDPRNIVRVLTVYQMKDRAGVVGAFGAGELLRDVLATKDVKAHLVGHSFGCKVMLSAIAAGEPFADNRQVDSLLLLQPAVSHLCMADKVTGTNRSGGYRNVLRRVRKPILSTFSAQDVPLFRLFHLAVRRAADLGEPLPVIAGEQPEPPNRFAALGGYGPRKAGETLINIKGVNDRYALDTGVPIYGVNGTGVITGHGDISNPGTWWALYCLVSAGRD